MNGALVNTKIVVQIGEEWWFSTISELMSDVEFWTKQANLSAIAHTVELRLVRPDRCGYFTVVAYQRDAE